MFRLLKSTFIFIVLFFACTPPGVEIEEPTSEELFVVIGSAVVEDDYYTEYTGVHIEDVEVAILGEIVEFGAVKQKGFWTKTDENGYFAITNLPPGKYALTAVRVFLNNQKWVTISNSLTSPDSKFEINEFDHVGFVGNYFDILPQGRVVNLQNNFFSLDNQNQDYLDVKYIRRNEIIGMKLVDGSKLELYPPDRYFAKRFAGSAWVPVIRESF